MFAGEDVSRLAQIYQRSCLVLKRNNMFFSLAMGVRTEVVSVDWLKQHLGESEIQHAQCPSCGCPTPPISS